MANSSNSFRNHLLIAMSPDDRSILQPFLEPVGLALYYDLEKPSTPIESVYFMESGIASVVAVVERDTRIEIGLIGREGMTGAAVVLNGGSSPHETYIQVAGDGQRISTKELRSAMKKSETLTSLLLKFAQAFMVQTAHTAIANARGKIDQRLARWLLMAHDRIDGDELPLTHEFLALMLGVRRAGVTESVSSLEGQGMIRARRGRITVTNRRFLEKRAGGFYGIPEAELRRLFG
jgi:CRP-like cAMP-binding protein